MNVTEVLINRVSNRNTAYATDNNDIAIRPLKWQDVGPLIQLKRAIDREAAYLAAEGGERKDSLLFVLLRMIANRKRMHTFVASNEEELIGYITVIRARFKKLKGNAYLTISVRETHRGQGIGTKLMEAAEQFVRDRNGRRMELEVFAKNQKAIKLYERLGYEHEGRRRNAVEDVNGFDDVIFMAKFLR